MSEALIRVLVPAACSFLLALLATPILTHYLYKHQAWKKRAGKRALDGSVAQEFNRLHENTETRAPRMGGVVIWGGVAITMLLLALLSMFVPFFKEAHLSFLNREQTWIPFAALMVGAFVGFLDDLLVIRPSGEGLPLRFRLGIVFLLSAAIGWWFWDKLGVVSINLPFSTPLEIGWLIIPLFVCMSLGVYASGVIDGIDGLAGGVFASIFGAYAVIAFTQYQISLAAFCASIVGATVAFLWFNIPPARFYMSDTGTMALTLALAVVAFMTDTPGDGIGITLLPIIGGLLVITVVSNILQMVWKHVFKRKLLRIAPLHHHFEAIGWPGYKVVMRYWVLSIILAFFGVLISLLSY